MTSCQRCGKQFRLRERSYNKGNYTKLCFSCYKYLKQKNIEAQKREDEIKQREEKK